MLGGVLGQGISTFVSALCGTTVGIIGGYLFFLHHRVGAVFTGVAGGLVLGLELNGWCLHLLYDQTHAPSWVSIAVVASLACLGGLLGLLPATRGFAIIFTSSLAGGYMAGWGLLQVGLGLGNANTAYLSAAPASWANLPPDHP